MGIPAVDRGENAGRGRGKSRRGYKIDCQRSGQQAKTAAKSTGSDGNCHATDVKGKVTDQRKEVALRSGMQGEVLRRVRGSRVCHRSVPIREPRRCTGVAKSLPGCASNFLLRVSFSLELGAKCAHYLRNQYRSPDGAII